MMLAVSFDYFRQVARGIPIVWDCYAYYFGFYRNVAICRGVFSSFDEARSAAPQRKPIGYNQKTIGNFSNIARLTAQRDYDEFDFRDEPILRYLERLMGQNSQIFNLGGNVGTEYYAYRKRVVIPDGTRWIVCEIPEIAAAGCLLAEQKAASNLDFVTDFLRAEGCDIILTCGALQYIEQDLSTALLALKSKPLHVLINRTAMYDGDSFVTLQNLGFAYAPYTVRNREAFVEGMLRLGYGLVDSWRDSRVTRIPFHPRHTVRGYCGFYFKLQA
jgi:putative methyltransferase (TIGR04325 family)